MMRVWQANAASTNSTSSKKDRPGSSAKVRETGRTSTTTNSSSTGGSSAAGSAGGAGGKRKSEEPGKKCMCTDYTIYIYTQVTQYMLKMTNIDNYVLAAPASNKSKRVDSEDGGDLVPAGGTGFDRGLEAEKILGASDNNGRLTFLIQFKGVDQAEMVPSTVANVKIPQMVIRFYEERLSWYSDNED